jgi:phosphoglycolate phosphatase
LSRKLRLIVFDLDGTLIDSRRDLVDSANALLAAFEAPPLPEAAVVAMVGEGARTLVTRVLDAAGVATDVDAALARFLDLYDQRLTHHTRLYPGVGETVDALAGRGVAMAVLTNKPQRPTTRLLDHFDLTRRLAGAIGGDTAYGRKPDPAGLLALLQRVGAAPESTLMVGDSWVDIETARRAGTRACFVDYGFGLPPEGGLRDTEPRLAHVDELLALVDDAPVAQPSPV